MSIDPQSLARLSFTVDAGAKTLVIGCKAPFKMWLPDPAVAGSFVHRTITAPATINGDGHASENFNLGEAGSTLAVAWADKYPLTWYLTIKAGDVYWVASRNPCMTQMPAAGANIGDFDAAPATGTNQANVFVAASITEADFVDLPVWPIGTMPVTRAAASEIPTLVALTAGLDGPGLWNSKTTWAGPLGQNGAVAGHHTGANGATWTTPGSETSRYKQGLDGTINFTYETENAGACVNGSNTAGLQIYVPVKSSQYEYCQGSSQVKYGGTWTTGAITLKYQAAYAGLSAGAVTMLNNGFNNVADDIYATIVYNGWQ